MVKFLKKERISKDYSQNFAKKRNFRLLFNGLFAGRVLEFKLSGICSRGALSSALPQPFHFDDLAFFQRAQAGDQVVFFTDVKDCIHLGFLLFQNTCNIVYHGEKSLYRKELTKFSAQDLYEIIMMRIFCLACGCGDFLDFS